MKPKQRKDCQVTLVKGRGWQPQEKNDHKSPSSFSTLCQPSHRRGTSSLECHHQGADGVVTIHWHLWSRMEEVTGQDDQVLSNVPAFPPAVMFLTQSRWKFDILYLKSPQEAQQGVHPSICAVHVAAEQLHWGSPVFVLQSQHEFTHSEHLLLHGFRAFMQHPAHVPI